MRSRLVFILLGSLWSAALALGQANGNLQIHFMDVGQGDGALLISPQGETVLFDDGALNNCDKPLSYIQQLGVRNIDYHIASHYHSDHIGCATAVFHDFPLRKDALDRGGSYASGTYKDYITAVGTHRKTAAPDMTVTLDAASATPVIITIVCADATTDAGQVVQTSNENDLSVSAVVHFGNFAAEIGGDLSGHKTGNYEDIETSVAPKVGQIEVYKVHHHGSAYSSNLQWLSTTIPQIGIISCGDGNSYGHPTVECVEALHQAGLKLYWTERGNGVQPDPGFDVVGGNIIVDVPAGSKTYTVTYGGTKTDSYTVRIGAQPGVQPGTMPATPTPTPSGPLAGIQEFAWSKRAAVYHYANCRYVANISPANLEKGTTPPEGKTLHQGCPK
jgi:beta-lactamase superfamily II metal-dependent hydrolase